ncbi:MAG: chemotaxis protein CheA [Deltaproteobacteria bacterium]|nr:chemotaxis protein CheA [Deltaproteobacteria bacterium]
MMEYDNLIALLNSMASDILFLDGTNIDIPSTGKFLNQLDEIIKEAENVKVSEVKEVAQSLAGCLEKIILGTDEGAGLTHLVKGTSLMQEIVDAYKAGGAYHGDLGSFHNPDSPSAVASADSPSPVPAGEEEPQAEKFQIQDESLLKDFIVEGLEYIDEIEVNILNLENNPDDKDYINAIFRPFHSIKGVASFLNLENIRDLAHNLESLLDKARNGELQVKPPLIDVVLDGADALKTMIGSLKSELEGKGKTPVNIDLAALGARIKSVERGVAIITQPEKIGEILIADGVITEDVLEEGLKVAQASPEKKIGEALISKGAVTPKQVSQALRKQADQITDTSTVRVDIGKLDDMIDMVGELVITQSMIQQDLKNQLNADKNLTRDISQFFRVTSELQRVSTSLRMVPIKQTFQRMSRLVRDLAKNAGKVISVEMVGEDTEIDRNMVDEIYNPLVHMIRNSVDHGIEPPEERKKVGKPERGLIKLKAYHRGGNVVIEIADDGKGLNKEKILQKAVKNGVISSMEGLSDSEIYRLVFVPGLSTAEKVTDVSGRGVGMDVVKQAVEKLRGKIEIESVSGSGTSFITRFPLTMAIIDGMIVKVGSEHYILPTTAIRQALRPLRESYNSIVGKGETVDVMGHIMPLVRLYKIFNIEAEHQDPWDAIVVVVEGENRSKCLLVDKIIGKAEVVIKSLGSGFKKVKGVSGGAIMGDGRIGLILDPEGLFELSETIH